MKKSNTQIENIIIISFLFQSMLGDNLFMDYYYEKCKKYLGFAPNPDIIFKDYKDKDQKYIYDFEVKSIENIIDSLFENNLMDKISKSDNIFEYDDVHGRTTRGNGKYRKILGLHELLTREILKTIDTIPEGVLRKFNLKKLLCENTI